MKIVGDEQVPLGKVKDFSSYITKVKASGAELLSFLTIGEATGKKLVLFGSDIDVHATLPWIVAAACLIGGGWWLRREGRAFHRVWEALTADLQTEAV